MDKRKCVWCGKEFMPNSPKQTSCGDKHFRPCIDCGKLIEVKESYQNYIKAGGRRCPDCRNKAIGQTRKSKSSEEKNRILEKMRATSRARYGVDNPMQCSEIQERSKQGVRRIYGVENLSQSPEIQQRIRENSRKRYGVDHYSQSPEIREHMIKGMIDKYGDSCPNRVPEIRDKTIQTVRNRYGVDNVGQSDEIKERMKKTCQERYGVDYALQSEEIRNQIRETCKSKYGCYGAPPKLFLKKMEDETFRIRYTEFIDDPSKYIDTHYDGHVSLNKLVKDLELDFTTVYDIVDKQCMWDKVSKQISSMEVEVMDYLKSLDPDIIIITHDRNVIHPYEIDIYLPEYHLGIECNPTFTHNSSFKSFGNTDPIKSSYHKMKTDLCEAKGVFLFHIFGYEWTNRKDIILSMIRNMLKKNKNRIYARKCSIRTVDDKICAEFLNQNHRQGYCRSSVRLGLYYEDEIVSLMTFGHTRIGIGKMLKDTDSTYELLRFCNKINISVVGGASKLFKHFLSTVDSDKIVSFSDRSHTQGSLYRTLGFHAVSMTDPGYVWVNIYNDQCLNRTQCQKNNLTKLFNDATIDIENKTERQIMEEHGYARVYDSGVIRWEYTL